MKNGDKILTVLGAVVTLAGQFLRFTAEPQRV